ncbi:MAG: FeoB-associated Cys-rich membrane protein [Eubacteriales bacterium]
MLLWIRNNISTIIICAVLLVIVGAIIHSVIRKKKNEGSSCGCGCSHCSMNGVCHEKKKD